MSVFLVLIVATYFNLVIASRSDIYTGYSVHGVELHGRSDQIVLYKLQTENNVDIWEHGAPGSRDAFIMLSPKNREEVFDILDASDLKHYLHIADVAKAIEEHESDLSWWKMTRKSLVPFQTYPTYDEVNEYLERIAREYPSYVSLVNAGKSYEGRDIKYLKISTSNFSDPTKPIYFMDATMHAREWVTTPVTLYTIHRLVEELRTEDLDLIENIDWIVLPIVNPDGYVYTHSGDRLWRKSRSFNSADPTCYGVDLNRNFDVNFNTLGVSSNSCALNYPGEQPFSEPETGYVRDILFEYIERIQIYMNIHSHGYYILYGYGNTTLPSNVAQLHYVGAAMGAQIDALKLPQAGFYKVGNSNLVLYGSSGSAQDYGQAVGVPFSYTLELPGYGYGFLVPPEFIEQINAETWQGIVVTARLSYLYYNARKQS